MQQLLQRLVLPLAQRVSGLVLFYKNALQNKICDNDHKVKINSIGTLHKLLKQLKLYEFYFTIIEEPKNEKIIID